MVRRLNVGEHLIAGKDLKGIVTGAAGVKPVRLIRKQIRKLKVVSVKMPIKQHA